MTGSFHGAIFNNTNNITVNILADFVNNTSAGNYGGIGNYGASAKIGSITGDFILNTAKMYGGIANLGGGYIGVIKGDFIGNRNSTTGNSGGAIQNQQSTIGAIYGDFIGNVSLKSAGGVNNDAGTIGTVVGNFIGNIGNDGGTGGAGINNYNASIGDVTGDFIGNYAKGNGGAFGVYAYKDGLSLGNLTGDFIGNYTKGAKGGGAICIDVGGNYTYTVGNISGDFIENYVESGGDVRGGAIYTNFALNNENGGIINASFIGNYVHTTVTNKTAQGGAIYTNKDLNFIARDGVTAMYSGNYVQKGSTKENQAIYVDRSGSSGSYVYPILTFNAYDGGKFIINDAITGAGDTGINGSRYKLNLSGVNAGDIVINNSVTKADISVNNDNLLDGTNLTLSYSKLNMINDTAGDMELSSLTLSNNNWLALDIFETSPATLDADTISTTTSGSGTLTIYAINYDGMASSTSRTVQILFSDPALQLALSSSSFTQTLPDYDVVTSVNQNTSWSDTYTATHYSNVSRTINVILDTTTHTKDSLTITSVTESSTSSQQSIDTLRAINQAEFVGPRSFETDSATATYDVTANIGATAAGDFTVQGVVSGSDISTVDLGSYTGFELSNAGVNLTFKDVKVTGANDLVTVSDNSAVINTNNAYIDGNIVSANPLVKQGTVNVNAAQTDATTFAGNISVDTISLNDGTLKFISTTDVSATDKFVSEGGTLDLSGGDITSYAFNKLILNEDMGYVFDIDLLTSTTDKITLNSTLTPNDNNIIVTKINLTSNSARRITKLSITDSNLASVFATSGDNWKAVSKFANNDSYDGLRVDFNSDTGVLSYIRFDLADRTLDEINTASTNYIEDTTRSTVALSATQGVNTNSIVIDGTTYWYTTTNNDLINLVATGHGALRETNVSTGAVFSYDDGVTVKYYTYDTTALPYSAWTREAGTELNHNYYVVDNHGNKTYYKVNIPTVRLGKSENVFWSDVEPASYTGSVTVYLPNNETKEYYYTYAKSNDYTETNVRVTNINAAGAVEKMVSG